MTYIARAVVLHLFESTDRFCCDADRRSNNAGTEGCVSCPARQVVLQHVAVRCTGSVGRHGETPRREACSCHEEQQQNVPGDRNSAGLTDG